MSTEWKLFEFFRLDFVISKFWKHFLPHFFWQLVFIVSNSQPNLLLLVGSVTANLIWEFSNVSMLFFIYIVFFYYIFSRSYMASQNLVPFFWNKKLFGGFTEWPILMTVNLHLFELKFLQTGSKQNLCSLTVPPFNTLIPGGNKSSYILKINSSFLAVGLAVWPFATNW